MMLLSDGERDRFAAWLELEASTEKGLIEQMEKIGVPEFVIAHKKTIMQAKALVARELRKTHTDRI